MSNILELFKSIQGEGETIGYPSLFIRFKNCNLHCQMCDTSYSHTEDGKYTLVDAINFINSNPNYRHVIFTGGEPMLHQTDIAKLISVKNIIPIIESNCTIAPSSTLHYFMQKRKGTWSMSPKFQALDPFMIKCYNSFPNSYFKFVISDIPHDIAIIQKLFTDKIITKPYVIVQPNGNTSDYNKACRELCEYIISNNLTNLRPIPQFHKICWGNKREV